jgi:transposase
MNSELDGYEARLAAMVEKYPDATLLEYCEYFGETYEKWVSNSTMRSSLKKQQLTLKST